MTIIIGIDPGLTGACAVLDHQGVRAVFDLPTMPVPGAGPKALVQRKIDSRALCSLLLKHCPADAAKPQVILEQVNTMGGANNAVQTQGSLMRSLGAIETVLECLRFPVEYVAPQRWKRRYGLGSDKKEALETARGLYGELPELKRQKDHNRAEAVLLAHWGKIDLLGAQA